MAQGPSDQTSSCAWEPDTCPSRREDLPNGDFGVTAYLWRGVREFGETGVLFPFVFSAFRGGDANWSASQLFPRGEGLNIDPYHVKEIIVTDI